MNPLNLRPGDSLHRNDRVAVVDGDGDNDEEEADASHMPHYSNEVTPLDPSDASEDTTGGSGIKECTRNRILLTVVPFIVAILVVTAMRKSPSTSTHQGIIPLSSLSYSGYGSVCASGGNSVTSTTGTSSAFAEQMEQFEKLRASSSLTQIANGAVAADHPICSEMGVSIMRDHGGNAIDAAVTVALCLGVVNPASSGLGGGAFILVHADQQPSRDTSNKPNPPFHDARTTVPLTEMSDPNMSDGKITEVIDCREVAPSEADKELFTEKPPSASVFGGLAVAVPGELKGLELAHARHGSLTWTQVVQPARDLARDGSVVNANFAHEIASMASTYKSGKYPDYGLRALLTHDDNWEHPYREGEVFRNPALAETLTAIMVHGADALYAGPRSEALARDIQSAGGIVSAQDIANYRPTLRSPVVARDVNGFTFVGVPPPSSGGAVIMGAARFLAGYASPWASSPETLSLHRFVEACRHAFAIRMSLSDPAYHSDTVVDAIRDLTQGSYIDSLRQSTRDDSTLPLSQYGGSKWSQLDDKDGSTNATDAKEGDRARRRSLARRFGYLEDRGTSHFSVVDDKGNAVAMTTSVNTYFGSKVVSGGIVLGNTMDDFATPGHANFFGLKPSPANYIQPGKKPLSSMSPTFVFRQREGDSTSDLVLVIGASGGPKIITAVLQVIIRTIWLGQSLFDAVLNPRIHEQLIYHGSAVTTTERSSVGAEGFLMLELPNTTRQALSTRGHKLLDIDYTGTVQAISIDLESNTLSAVCDTRKGGTPAGY